MDTLTARIFRAGDVIIREGAEADAAYLIESGRVAVYRTVDGREVALATLGEGDIFGEMALVDGRPRSASVRAAVYTVCIVITREGFQRLIAEGDPLMRALVARFVRVLREQNDRLADHARARDGT